MISEKIKNCVNQNDKKSLYIILSDYLIESFEKIDKNIEYIQRHMDIFLKYDQKEFEKDKEKWNEKYLFDEKAKLITNFSKERVDHIKNIIRKLYPERNKEFSSSRTCFTSTSKRKVTSNKKDSDDYIIPKAAIGVGVVLTGAGLLTLKASLTIIGVGVAAIGVVYLYKKNN